VCYCLFTNHKFDLLFIFSEENSRLKELLNVRQEKNSENNKNNNSDLENCAILGIHLPQPTEYEYLRNILFEFMMGREPVVSWIIYQPFSIITFFSLLY